MTKKKSNCVFSKFVICRDKPSIFPLANLPCVNDLLSNDPRIPSSCEISRPIDSRLPAINIINNIWILYHQTSVKYCTMHSSFNHSVQIISINESSILTLPCVAIIKCLDFKFTSSSCKQQTRGGGG